jgi:hypothetical protein
MKIFIVIVARYNWPFSHNKDNAALLNKLYSKVS